VLAGEMPVAGPRASEGQRGLEFLWFGDCAAIVEQEGRIELVGETMEKRQAEAARAKKMARQLNLSAASGIDRAEIQPLLRAARNRINSKGNWLFSPDRRAAAHVARHRLEADDGALLLIASDGFLALVSDYGAYDTAGLMAAAREKGLAALGQELRAIEQDDALAEKFPRFKKSDDATAILLRVSSAPS
jgi:serine/threonine protein phosphatase PrpC